MIRPSRRLAAAGFAAAFAGAACGAAAGQTSPAPATSPSPAPAASPPPVARADTGARRHTAADVRFMRGMIAHHGQALEMTALVPARTPREDLRILARRIEISQRDEIATMRRWLQDRGEAVPSAEEHAHHAGTAGMRHEAMPGMLAPEEMARLSAATGAEFERLFLELMIRHHQGALSMVAELLATPGAAQEADTFRFASDVDADQRAEIARMQRMLAAAPPAVHR
jgi:uncharacterized protein (DUF305 family)